ncbi:hypothetical protein [Nocardia bovistercoris]|nr:hypothetical protein [Nocardia bovistercoris]
MPISNAVATSAIHVVYRRVVRDRARHGEGAHPYGFADFGG